tara:strand:+ start:445 stop:645 length:201 start_codon:yes stop_codon:yes gene_type:complete
MTKESFEFWRDRPQIWRLYSKVLASKISFEEPPISTADAAWAWFAKKLDLTEDELSRLEAYHYPWD